MNLRCRDVEGSLLGGPAGGLAGEALAAREQHLATCEACRAAVLRWERWGARLRAIEPPSLSELALRRMERDVLQAKASGAPARRGGRVWLAGVALAGGLAAVLVLALRPSRSGGPAVVDGPASVTAVAGRAFRAGRPLAARDALARGDEVIVEEGGGVAVSVAVPTASQISLSGPAALVLEGNDRATELRLRRGTLHAEVTPLAPGQSFAVLLGDVRVAVRGTAFTVGYDERGNAWLEVMHGRVAVERAGRRELLVEPAGGRVSLAPAPREEGAGLSGEDEAPLAPGPAGVAAEVSSESSAEHVAVCAERAQRCAARASAVRRAMRNRAPAEALRLVAEAKKELGGCGRGAVCRDELGYLGAEALRMSGRDEAALGAFRALGATGGSTSMRQNALYAAGDLALRLGRPADAFDAYERALGAAPHGALREESMAGAFRAAAAARDPRARVAAARYLAAYPHGWAARDAEKVVAAGASSRASSPAGSPAASAP